MAAHGDVATRMHPNHGKRHYDRLSSNDTIFETRDDNGNPPERSFNGVAGFGMYIKIVRNALKKFRHCTHRRP